MKSAESFDFSRDGASGDGPHPRGTVWGAPFRALEELFGEVQRATEALGVGCQVLRRSRLCLNGWKRRAAAAATVGPSAARRSCRTHEKRRRIPQSAAARRSLVDSMRFSDRDCEASASQQKRSRRRKSTDVPELWPRTPAAAAPRIRYPDCARDEGWAEVGAGLRSSGSSAT